MKKVDGSIITKDYRRVIKVPLLPYNKDLEKLVAQAERDNELQRIRYKRLINYIKNNFDLYMIQGIALDPEEYVKQKTIEQLTPHQLMRREFHKINKRKILEKDKYRCRTCNSYKDLHIDHIIPILKGGTNDESNLQTLCRTHNLKKSNKLISTTEEF